MLDLTLSRAMAPDEMEPRPCGICGAEFSPRAVLCNFVTSSEYLPICEACVSHLDARAERENPPADWGEVVRAYRLALEVYPSPVFPSVEALLEADRRTPWGIGLTCEIDTAELVSGAA